MPTSYNEEAKTFDVTFTTEAPVKRYDWNNGTYYNEVLSFEKGHVNLDRLNNGANVLDNHNMYGSVSNAVLGVVERAWVEDGKGAATIRFSNRPEVQGIVQDVKDGILKNISIGYSITKLLKEEEEGTIPTYRAIEWEPYEISVVAIPADANAQVRSIQENLQTIEVVEPEIQEEESKNEQAAGPNARLLINNLINKY